MNPANAQQALVEKIREKIVRTCLDHGQNPSWSSAIGREVEEWLRREHGGSTEYIHALDKGQRNARILAEFRGDNHEALAEKFGVCVRRVQQIVKDAYGDR